MVSFTPWPFYLRYPLDRKLGRPQCRSGRRRKEEHVCHGQEFPLGFPALDTVAQSLYRLSYLEFPLYKVRILWTYCGSRLELKEQTSIQVILKCPVVSRTATRWSQIFSHLVAWRRWWRANDTVHGRFDRVLLDNGTKAEICQRKFQFKKKNCFLRVCVWCWVDMRPPLWSSGQSFWLQI